MRFCDSDSYLFPQEKVTIPVENTKDSNEDLILLYSAPDDIYEDIPVSIIKTVVVL